ncbi:MAG: hypothetical protein GXP46_13845 [Deferribacteres bacterium]|nr:hypothetical protein [Deferribacteres bacterium]
MLKKQDNGYILVTVLLLLLVLTIVGMSAIGTSSLENMLSGNIRLKERNIAKAEGGADISPAVIEETVRTQDTKNFADIINDPSLPSELRSTPFDPDGTPDASNNPDLAIDIHPDNPGVDVLVDIDKMYTKWMGGTAIEFASGYEGVGKSGGSGFYTFYRINSTGNDVISSSSCVGCIYRYVPK